MTEIEEEDKERKFKLLVLGIIPNKFYESTQELLDFQKQILQDHKKARKWDESLLGAMLKRDEITVGDYMQNIKLRGLVENQIEGFQIDKEYNVLGTSEEDQIKLKYLQQLLKESKK